MNTNQTNLATRYLWIFPVTIGFILRLFEITKSSIWHDEGYTMWLIRYDWSDIITRTARDVHPPAYYLIAKLWTMTFGSSVFSIRFLSLLFSVGIIYLVYKIVESIWSTKAAYWSSLFIAFSPFLIRFGQEARMYGVVAFFTTLAAYFFVRCLKDKEHVNTYLVLFTLSMITAMYTQYYSFFVIISLWVIYAVITKEFWQLHWIRAIKESKGVFCWKWWLANIALLALYLPWFYVAFKQVTRVSGSYWIKPEWITIKTIPSNILQFVTYNHFDFLEAKYGGLGLAIYWLIIVLLIGSGIYLFFVKDKLKVAVSLFIYGYLPMLLVFIVSKLRTPIYQDRYFPFSALAVFVIWGVLISLINSQKIRVITGTIFLIVLTSGVYYMHKDVNHQMNTVYQSVSAENTADSPILSGSLYTFLDGSYYFDYGNIKLISENVDGYGETSLFYDQGAKYMIKPDQIATLGTNVWIIGRPGENYIKDTEITSWKIARVIQEGTVTATLYTK